MTQMIMSPLILQICNLIDNSLKLNQIQIYHHRMSILHIISRLRELAT